MASVSGQVVYWMLKRANPGTGREATWEQRRTTLEAGAGNLPMPPNVTVRQTRVGEVPAEWLVPGGAPDDCALLYLHGGAYTMGSCVTHRALAARIALAGRAPVLLPEYRLAPEHPFPAALDDGLAVYRWLLEGGVAPGRVVVAGDSAGGGLAVALAVALRGQAVPLPAGLVCLSPWADLALTGESVATRARVDPLCSLDGSQFHAAQYLGGHDPRSPLISPIYADLSGLPPLLIQVGDREILLSDSVRLADRARQAGVDTELDVWQDMWHVWQLFARFVPEGKRAIDRIGAFVRRHLDGGQSNG